MDIDGTDAFNRLLERVEELADSGGRDQRRIAHLERRITNLVGEQARLLADNQACARLERFVQSTPEMQAAWQKFVTDNPPVPKSKPALVDDIPF